jgi:hypothetical protein
MSGIANTKEKTFDLERLNLDTFQTVLGFCTYKDMAALRTASSGFFNSRQSAFLGVFAPKEALTDDDFDKFSRIMVNGTSGKGVLFPYERLITVATSTRRLSLSRISLEADTDTRNRIRERLSSIFTATLSTNCPALTSLDLANTYPAFQLRKNILPHLPLGLRSLSLSHTNCGNRLIQELSTQCPTLTSLEVPVCLTFDTEVDSILTNFRELTSLDISWGTSLTRRTAELCAEKGRSLTSLSLASCVQLNDEDVVTIVSSCNQLSYLNISNITLNDPTMQSIATCLPELDTLSFEYCSHITDVGLHHLAGCKKLRNLFLSDNDEITLEGAKHLMDNCRSLQQFICHKCPEISQREYHDLMAPEKPEANHDKGDAKEQNSPSIS